jgi:hypothetical protein
MRPSVSMARCRPRTPAVLPLDDVLQGGGGERTSQEAAQVPGFLRMQVVAQADGQVICGVAFERPPEA